MGFCSSSFQCSKCSIFFPCIKNKNKIFLKVLNIVGVTAKKVLCNWLLFERKIAFLPLPMVLCICISSLKFLTRLYGCNVKVIGKLSEGKASHVPYRDSKLTRLLQSSLSGHGHVSVSLRCKILYYWHTPTFILLHFSGNLYISLFKWCCTIMSWIALHIFLCFLLDDFWSTKYSLTIECTFSTTFPESISNDTNRTISTNIIVYFPSLYVQLLPHQATWRKHIIHWSLQVGQSEWKSMPHVIRCVATNSDLEIFQGNVQ